MRNYIIAVALIGVAGARCPDIGPDAFADILHNHAETTVFGGTDYRIEKRKVPDFAIESTKRPRITVNGNGHRCHYARKIGKTRFGSFTLERKHRNEIVIIERGPHHHRQHHW